MKNDAATQVVRCFNTPFTLQQHAYCVAIISQDLRNSYKGERQDLHLSAKSNANEKTVKKDDGKGDLKPRCPRQDSLQMYTKDIQYSDTKRLCTHLMQE